MRFLTAPVIFNALWAELDLPELYKDSITRSIEHDPPGAESHARARQLATVRSWPASSLMRQVSRWVQSPLYMNLQLFLTNTKR